MNKERLLQLADHLENGQLGHKVFDFDRYNASPDEDGLFYFPEYSCGTNGCAIGECPIVWPEHWFFNKHGWPILIELDPVYGNSERAESDSAMQWFDIRSDEFSQLFTPLISCLHPSVAFGIEGLTEKATKDQVAANIRKFVAWKEAQK